MDIINSAGLYYYRKKFFLMGLISKKWAARSAFQLFITPQTRVKPSQLPLFTEADNINFEVNNLIVHGYRWNAGSKKKLVILHGYESSVVNFSTYIEKALEKDFEVIAVDAPAHGLSEGRSINAIDYKNFVLALVKRYGPVKNFITHSFGGLALGLTMEELEHDENWKLVFIAPATESTRAVENFFRFLQLDRGIRKHFDDIIEKANNKPTEWYSLARASANIKAQVLFVQDKQDEFTPLSDVEPIIKQNYPNFQFKITEGLGHSRIYRDKEVVEHIMAFF